MVESVVAVAIVAGVLLAIGLSATALVIISGHKNSVYGEDSVVEDERSVSRRQRLRGAVVVLDMKTKDAVATTLHDVKDQLEEIGDHEAAVEPGEICSICLSEFDEEDGNQFVSSTCHHPYHLNCIGKWVYRRRDLACPICRTNFVPDEENPTFEKFIAGEHSPADHVTEVVAVA
ncbi:hypothetical protein NDN08_007174 [Rhodosorus marinus]|uniref:RING-type domain-containing protein n=1 Tax=Rhodosorus marinus TaxID=101924 RepID=A0AAV8UFT6_9RHOD|nr:hypothetical protein NDN08_007174 [Rhodosorus marinus]